VPKFAPVDPKQSFPDLEQAALERWREQGLFARTLAERADAPIWSFYEGPPTANGRPGSHHVLARVFKDIYPRYRTMCGYRVPRKAGWDCHGLPVELEVEKQLGISSKDEIETFGIAEFNQRCRESVFEYVEEWNRLTERIGYWIDLDDPYVTLEDRYIESVWWSLSQLFEGGRLYEGHKVVPYCPRDGTPLSSHEVAQGYQDVKDASIYVRFPLVDADAREPGESLLVWTTTPWTLPGNKAVAVNPGVTYARARVAESGEVLIVARDLAEKVLGEGAEVLEELDGSALLDLRYAGPIFDLGDVEPGAYPVIAGDFVTTEDGTGLVHIAPPFGEDDYAVAAAAGIFDPTISGTLYNPVRPNGTFDDRVIGFAGEFVKGNETTRRLIERLSRSGLLFREQVYEHAYPHCWRCGTPLLYYATTSWYIGTSAVRDDLLANNETIGWHPEHVKHGRFGKWLENNVDWALSRNRYWGTPLPIWRCDDGCGSMICVGSKEDLVKHGGSVPDDLHRPYIDEVTLRCEGCGGAMHRVSSVIDTWYDSGAMPFAQFHYPFEGQEEFAARFPADYICEAQDQTRGWFYTLLAESTLLFEQSSFKNCVCLGLILDPEGQKMSKSRGNVVDPWDVLAAHGADAFRWYYLTAQQPWAGYRFSVDTVGESVRQFMLTLWNTYSFWVLYANASDGLAGHLLSQDDEKRPADLTDLDRWALSRLQATVAIVRERMDDFDATTAGRAIAEFVDELSNWYVRLSRRRFWDGDAAAFATLHTCLLETTKMLAPFTPFLADEIYRNLVGGADLTFGDAPDSVHLADFPAVDEALLDPDLEAGMAAVQRTVRLGHAARSAGKVKVRQPLRRAVIVANEDERASIEALADLVTSELNVMALDFVSEEGELVSYTVKPNYRTLGPRFGKNMPQVAAAVAALDASSVAQTLSEGGEVGISIDGHDHTLGPDDLTLALAPLEGYEVEAEAGHAVALQLEIDEELRRAGLAREVVRAVQDARKNAGLEITDRIELGLGGDGELLAVAQEHATYIAGETLATSITFGDEDGAGGTVSAATIDSRELRISVRPV
jgi:isoleucyl-tRNA synthetase